jgi:hypothetical protein
MAQYYEGRGQWLGSGPTDIERPLRLLISRIITAIRSTSLGMTGTFHYMRYLVYPVLRLLVREERRKLKKPSLANRFQSRIKDWVAKRNCSCQQTEFLLLAALDSIQNDSIGAKNKYYVAIWLAGRQGLRGDLAQRSRDKEDARYHYALALALYEEW